MQVVPTRNILGLDGRHEVPVPATSYEFGDAVRQVDEVLPCFRHDYGKPGESARCADADDVAFEKEAQVFQGQPQGQRPPKSGP